MVGKISSEFYVKNLKDYWIDFWGLNGGSWNCIPVSISEEYLQINKRSIQEFYQLLYIFYVYWIISLYEYIYIYHKQLL